MRLLDNYKFINIKCWLYQFHCFGFCLSNCVFNMKWLDWLMLIRNKHSWFYVFKCNFFFLKKHFICTNYASLNTINYYFAIHVLKTLYLLKSNTLGIQVEIFQKVNHSSFYCVFVNEIYIFHALKNFVQINWLMLYDNNPPYSFIFRLYW